MAITEVFAEEYLSIDERVKAQFSRPASNVSDSTLWLSIALPFLPVTQLPNKDAKWNALRITGSGHILNTIATFGVKHAVGRARPFTYNSSSAAREYLQERGENYSHRSFYSGHSSHSFTAAMISQYLHCIKSHRDSVRAFQFLEFALASSTASLRVRAGQHFYSDVIVGAAAGMMMGKLAYDRNKKNDGDYLRPQTEEYRAAILGSLFGAIWPHFFDHNKQVALVPTATHGYAIQWKKEF